MIVSTADYFFPRISGDFNFWLFAGQRVKFSLVVNFSPSSSSLLWAACKFQRENLMEQATFREILKVKLAMFKRYGVLLEVKFVI